MQSDDGEYLIAPNPGDARLTRAVTGVDHTGQPVEARVVAPVPVPETDRPTVRHPPKPPATAPPHA